jgi:hypothetical protein
MVNPLFAHRRAIDIVLQFGYFGQIQISGDSRGTTPRKTSSRHLRPVFRTPAGNSCSWFSCVGALCL